MFLVSFNMKSSKAKKIAAAVFLGILVIAAVVLSPKIGKQKALVPEADYSSEQAREFYLNMCGHDVELISSQQIKIPEKFTKTYAEYNRIQQKQGFDLNKYKGQTATLYTYSVKNYSEDEENVRATLIVCGGQIIAADMYLFEQNGFMCGLHGEC